MNETGILGVGIIGASADRGWAKDSHVPAIQGLRGLELAAVVSGSQEKADAAAKAFGAKAAYRDATAMFRDPGVDVVAVCVKVPDHRELVLGALAAGKHVYCEWPLGRDIAETEEMADAAARAGAHVVIGLQTRANPAAKQAREMLAAGVVGRVLSARVLSTTAAFGPKVEAAMAFGEDGANGVTLVTVQGAHTLDVAVAVLGGYAEVAALATTQFPEVEVGDDAGKQGRGTADHLLVMARMAGGEAVSIEVAGGRPVNATPFRLEVTGERGELALEGGAMRGFQSGRLRLLLNGKEEAVDEGELGGFADAAANVAGMYALLRDDLAAGTRTAPDFADAARLWRLVEDVLAASREGRRVAARDWPRG